MQALKRVLLITCLITIPVTNLFAQHVLQGSVMDNGGEFYGLGADPVVNALVTVTDQSDPARIFSAYTDSLGHYSITIALTNVDEYNVKNPGSFQLFQNYPNPFNPATIIGYSLPSPTNISLEVYDILGRKIRTLLDGFQTAAAGDVTWDATDDHGNGVPAGVYIYSMEADGIRKCKKMVLLDGQRGISPDHSHHAVAPESQPQRTSKTMSGHYLFQVTGETIAQYEQQDLEINDDLTLDVIARRTVTDIDGNVYPVIRIGLRWWMAENLRVTRYRNGDQIPHKPGEAEWKYLWTDAYCIWQNDTSNAAAYGCLYSGYAAVHSSHISPEGWHVPTDDEWRNLEMALGMSRDDSKLTGNDRGTDEGDKLKVTGLDWWEWPNTGATNEAGFGALGTGFRTDQSVYAGRKQFAKFWTSTAKSSGEDLYMRSIFHDRATISRWSGNMHPGYSIRLVKDEYSY